MMWDFVLQFFGFAVIREAVGSYEVFTKLIGLLRRATTGAFFLSLRWF